MGRQASKAPGRLSARKQRELEALDLLRDIRIETWSELNQALFTPDAAHTVALVRRVRRIGSFLGDPTPWRNVPMAWLNWYAAIETVPEMDLYAETPDWDECADVGLYDVDEGIMDLYAEDYLPEDDDDAT